MTFKESEHVNIIERLVELSGTDVPLDEIVKETWKLERRIPLYPGIVIMCMNSVVEKSDISSIRPGEKVMLTTSGGQIVGTVKQIAGDEIILEDAVLRRNEGEVTLKAGEIKKIEKLNDKTLEKVWPSLVFEDNKSGAK